MILNDKVAIVTGASRGIGRSIALLFSREGAKISAVARTEEDLKKLKSEIESAGGKCLIFKGDVSNEDDVKKVIEKTIDEFGKIDILVNNAGFGIYKPVVDLSVEEFDSMVGVNFRGVFLFTKYVLPYMMKQNSGVIINISSIAGTLGVKNMAVYSATKWAVNGFTESLIHEVREYNIRVASLCPGSVDTNFSNVAGSNPPSRDKVLKPEDVAQTALLIASLPERAMLSHLILRPTNPK
ncbi:MAG: SDR family oxidoreductase [Candidatus Kryptonium sp.]|nr:SDR family oxidoreductase [Candidatus Kryptonium sp.]MCX7763085.1 SDR family oxidoreductase [Candidatus Kryptonium sp.]MDW8108426.1 SDR family oxidoreductase [Candidatus Kryptonium sp.]